MKLANNPYPSAFDESKGLPTARYNPIEDDRAEKGAEKAMPRIIDTLLDDIMELVVQDEEVKDHDPYYKVAVDRSS